MSIKPMRTSGLLRQVNLRVLPAAILILLVIWVTVGQVSDYVFQAEIDAKLKQQAESQAIFARTRLETLVTNVTDIAGNDLIINGMVDTNAEVSYLKPFLRSIAIEGFSDIPIVLTDYRGRPIAGRHLDAWRLSDLADWNSQVSQGKSVITKTKNAALVIGVPVRIGHLVEGMLVVRFLPEELRALLSSIGAKGQVDLVSADGAVAPSPPSEWRDAYSQVELVLPESDGLKLVSTIHSEADNESSYFQWFMFIAFVLDLVALIFGIFAAVSLVITPLNRFITHLHRYQRNEDMNPFDGDTGPSEIRQLADAFNQFVTSEKELLQERSQQAERLKSALEREKELNGLQRQFVSMVCHEFRTPLAIIDGNAHHLLSRHREMPAERLERVFTKIRLSVVRLTDLMESVLNAARLEAGKIKFQPEPCSPAETIEEVVANYQEVNSERQFTVDLEQLPAEFVMDTKLMRQVISNLMSNAIKYSPDGAMVRIEGSSTDDGHLVISVHDGGVGIPKAELDRLFERFFRASTSTGIPGTGIGLHMVKALIDLHDGHIDVTSEEGKGSTFSIYLPKRSPELLEPVFVSEAIA